MSEKKFNVSPVVHLRASGHPSLTRIHAVRVQLPFGSRHIPCLFIASKTALLDISEDHAWFARWEAGQEVHYHLPIGCTTLLASGLGRPEPLVPHAPASPAEQRSEGCLWHRSQRPQRRAHNLEAGPRRTPVVQSEGLPRRGPGAERLKSHALFGALLHALMACSAAECAVPLNDYKARAIGSRPFKNGKG